MQSPRLDIAAAAEVIARAKTSRAVGARVTIGIVADGALVLREELPSQYAARQVARELEATGYRRSPERPRGCENCDLIFEPERMSPA